MSGKDEANLFEAPPTPDGVARGSDPDDPVGAGVLTNRWNLVEFMSRRLITPPGAMSKYYRDLMQHSRDRVVIVGPPFTAAIADEVCSEDPDSLFPVFLELDAAPDGSPVAIPMERVKSVHFRSEKERSEQAAREFPNVPEGPPWVVSPHVFDSVDGTGPDDVPPQTETGAGEIELLRSLDRYTGAVTLACRRDVASTAISGVLAHLIGADTWDGGPVPWLADAARLLVSAETDDFADAPTENRLFHRIVKSVLAGERTIGDPVALAESLLDEFKTDDAVAVQLKKVVDVLDGEATFTPFRDRGSPVVKGLLLFLMRPQPENLLAWPDHETGADEATGVTAHFLCGLLHGRRVLPLDLRPQPLDVALAQLEADLANGAVATECEVRQDSDQDVLFADGTEVLRLSRPPVPLASLVAEGDTDRKVATDALAALANAQSWSELVSTVIRVPEGFRLEPGGESIVVHGIVVPEVRVDVAELVARLQDGPEPSGPEVDTVRKVLAPTKRRRRSQAQKRPSG